MFNVLRLGSLANCSELSAALRGVHACLGQAVAYCGHGWATREQVVGVGFFVAGEDLLTFANVQHANVRLRNHVPVNEP